MSVCKVCHGTGQAPSPEATPAAPSFELTSRREAGLARWQRRPPKKVDTDLIVAMIVHDTGVWPADVSTPAWVRGMQRYHQAVKGWSDEAYNFAVGRDGECVEVRGLEWDGFAEGATRRSRKRRYAGCGRGWPTVYGDIPWNEEGKFDFATRAISVVTQLGPNSDDVYERPSDAMLDSLRGLRAWASAQLGRELWVDVHRAHKIKPCPGPHLADHAEHGRLGPWPEGVQVTSDAERKMLVMEYLAAKKGQAK